MHFDWNAQRGRATVTSRQVPVVRIAAVAGTAGLLAVSAPVIWTAVSAGIGLARSRRWHWAALLFLCVNPWEVCSLLRLKRATQFLDLTRPCAARHLGFNWYRRAFGVDFGKLGGRGCGYDSFRIHDKCPARVESARPSQCVSF